MKSSISISRGGRSITFKGAAARHAFEGMTGTNLPASHRQAVGRAARYHMHVVGDCVLLSDYAESSTPISDYAAIAVAHTTSLHGNRRILYRDPVSGWAELKHNAGRFTEFARLTDDEVEWCKAHAV